MNVITSSGTLENPSSHGLGDSCSKPLVVDGWDWGGESQIALVLYSTRYRVDIYLWTKIGLFISFYQIFSQLEVGDNVISTSFVPLIFVWAIFSFISSINLRFLSLSLCLSFSVSLPSRLLPIPFLFHTNFYGSMKWLSILCNSTVVEVSVFQQSKGATHDTG
jgi:hypothetical protein